MKVLVIGSGGREHAICYALSKSSKVTEIHAIPGNPGIAKLGACHNVSVEDLEYILKNLPAPSEDDKHGVIVRSKLDILMNQI